jgi:peroxin-14
MATLAGGVTFGLYATFKRYVLPLLAPPTPAQLATDKSAIDASFERAFAALSALEADTKALKAAEDARTQRLDAALADLEAALERLRESDRARDDDAKRNADEMRRLADALAKGLEGQKAATENRVRDLTGEVRSLKALVAARVGGGGGGANGVPAAAASPTTTTAATSTQAKPAAAAATNGDGPKSPAANGTAADAGTSTTPEATAAPAQAFPRFGSGKPAAIPAWQMAAAKKASQETLRDAAAKKDEGSPLQAQVEEDGEHALAGAA